MDPNTTAEEVFNIIKNRTRKPGDVVTRALYFQSNAFPGISVDKGTIAKLLQQLGESSKKAKKAFTFPSIERAIAEKGIHRLLTIGVIKDYTIDYRSNEFVIEFSGAEKKYYRGSFAPTPAGPTRVRA